MKVIIGDGKVSKIIRGENDVVFSHLAIEITDKNSIESALRNFPVGTVVINTAAKINLEWCEENKDEAYRVNSLGPKNLGEVCKNMDLHLVHISSGCIFDGMETEYVYNETDKPSPASWYAKTKVEGDNFLFSCNYEKITVVRPRQLISPRPYQTNMITKFLNLGKGAFITSKNSLTCIEDMKDMIDHLISGNHYGVYNLANGGYSSPYEIANRIKQKLNPGLEVSLSTYEDYLKSLKVKRVNTLLDISKLISTGYIPRQAEEAIDWCLENYGKLT
jgi:dTDP-4-dehydrorhamnose reductase